MAFKFEVDDSSFSDSNISQGTLTMKIKYMTELDSQMDPTDTFYFQLTTEFLPFQPPCPVFQCIPSPLLNVSVLIILNYQLYPCLNDFNSFLGNLCVSLCLGLSPCLSLNSFVSNV